MVHYLGRRLLLLIPILVGVTTLVFLMRALIPGDPVEVILGGQTADRAALEQIRVQLGLDQPLPVQYARFVGGVLRGDLGTSIRTGQPVTAEIGIRYPRSLALAGASAATPGRRRRAVVPIRRRPRRCRRRGRKSSRQ